MGRRTYTYDGIDWVGLTSTTADLSNYANLTNTPISGFRNFIINGDFRIWQRGTSQTSGGYGSADRWDAGFASGSFTQQTFNTGNMITGYEPNFFGRWTINSNSQNYELLQRIEGVRTLAGQVATISFWAKLNSGTVAVNARTVQYFGTGGSPSATSAQSLGSVNLTSNWQRFTFTTTIDSLLGKNIGTNNNDSLWFSLQISNTATGSIDIWGVQVERGSVATPFEQRPIGTELALCQRYYCSSVSNDSNQFHNGYFASPNSFNEGLSIPFPTRMRIVPTVSVSFVSVDNAVNGGQFVTADSFTQFFRASNGGFPYCGWRATYTASAEL